MVAFFRQNTLQLVAFIGLVLATSAWSMSVGHVQEATARRKFKYSGMTFTDERYCPNVSMSSERGKMSLRHLATTGANFVSIVVTQYQHLVNSTDIFPVYGSPIRCSVTPHGYCVTATDQEVIDTIRLAHELGMGVMLKLQIDLLSEPTYKIWRGFIGTNMTEEEWDLWFGSYTAALLHYAVIAEAEKVEMLSVSCELVTASNKTSHWRKLVPLIRDVYNGTLTDSANWAPPGQPGEENDKTWWDLVDVIGIDEYQVKAFNATAYKNGSFPTMADLAEVWRPIEKQLEALHKKWNKTIIFSEMGYCSGNEGYCFANGVRPPMSPLTTNASLQAQATQYDAAMTAMVKYEWFEGVFWWNWATDAAFGGTNNACMDPKFKPAEDMLRKWYNATQPKPSPPPGMAPICECWL